MKNILKLLLLSFIGFSASAQYIPPNPPETVLSVKFGSTFQPVKVKDLVSFKQDATGYKAVAKRILDLQQSTGGLPAVMTTPPTISLIGGYDSSPISGAYLVPATDYTKINYLASTPKSYTPSGPEWASAPIVFTYPGNVTLGTDGRSPGKQGWMMKVCFGTDADRIEIPIQADNSFGKSYRIIVDGQVTAVLARTDLTDFSFQRLVIVFSTAKPRKIIIESDQYVAFGGVILGPRYSVYKVFPDDLIAVHQGDSYSAGTLGDGIAKPINSLTNQISSLLGITNYINSSEGGLGYVTNGALSAKTAIQKLDTDVTLYAPNFILGALGYNDGSGTNAALQAAVTAYWTKVLTDNPNALAIAVGPFRSPANTVNITAKAAFIKAGIEAVPGYGTRLFYIDTIAKNYQSGTGRVGATQPTGNSSIYIGADNVHPVAVGQDYLAERIAIDILEILNTL